LMRHGVDEVTKERVCPELAGQYLSL